MLEKLRTPFAKKIVLAIRKSKELKKIITLKKCFIKGGSDCIRIKIRNLYLPQYPKYDIKDEETLEIEFDHKNEYHPRVCVCRNNFPIISHTFVDADRIYLCLYENTWDDVKSSWNPKDFLLRLFRWFNDAASGDLHRSEQELEPYMFPYSNAHAIFDETFLNGLDSGELSDEKAIKYKKSKEGNLYVYLSNDKKDANAIFLSINVPTKTNLGGKLPLTISDLTIINSKDFNLYDVLQHAFKKLNSIANENTFLWLILNLPISRKDGEPPEKITRIAIQVEDLFPKLLCKCGIFEKDPQSKKYVKLINEEINKAELQNAKIFVWGIHVLSSVQLCALNGHNNFDNGLLCIGCGALGSHVIADLSKSRFGNLQLVDKDFILPHNVAKHFLSDLYIAWNKAHALYNELNLSKGAYFDKDITKDFEEIFSKIIKGSTILDFSANTFVERFLSRNATDNRIISAYLNPLGNTMIIHVEDAYKKYPIDYVEHAFYGDCLISKDLNSIFSTGKTIQIASRCSDITNIVPNDNFEIFAGIASKKIKEILLTDANASTYVFKLTSDCSIKSFKYEVPNYKKISFEGFSCMISDVFIEKILTVRKQNLPKEIGGTIIGNFDNCSQRYYLIDILPPPPDSICTTDSFERGTEGNQVNLDYIMHASGGYLKNIGEWHSHPDNIPVSMSSIDRKAYEKFSENKYLDGFSPVMVIAGAEKCYVKIDSMEMEI